MNKRAAGVIVCLGFAGAGCAGSHAGGGGAKADGPTAGAFVVPVSEVEWEHLNPARGDRSPRAGTLWGDRNGAEATGFLVRFADGFSSPPHIHNVTYRGVVISGGVHNDDPGAAEMWMGPGSFWTQPKGEVHVTAARGDMNVAYIEIDEGPYLVWPVEEAFDGGERPVNVDASNIVWQDASVLLRSGSGDGSGGARLAYLWGRPGSGESSGALVELPAGFRGEIRAGEGLLRAVVVEGRARVVAPGGAGAVSLLPGSCFGSDGSWSYRVSSEGGAACVVYVRSEGRFGVVGEWR